MIVAWHNAKGVKIGRLDVRDLNAKLNNWRVPRYSTMLQLFLKRLKNLIAGHKNKLSKKKY